jgi:hypothetical protein
MRKVLVLFWSEFGNILNAEAGGGGGGVGGGGVGFVSFLGWKSRSRVSLMILAMIRIYRDDQRIFSTGTKRQNASYKNIMQIAGQRHIITPFSVYKVMSDQDRIRPPHIRRNRTQCQIGKEESTWVVTKMRDPDIMTQWPGRAFVKIDLISFGQEC